MKLSTICKLPVKTVVFRIVSGMPAPMRQQLRQMDSANIRLRRQSESVDEVKYMLLWALWLEPDQYNS